MQCRNFQKRVVDRWHSDLPAKAALNDLAAGSYVRLSTLDGSFFWAEVVRTDGKTIVVRSADNLPDGSVRIGERFTTSTGAVFNVV
jgi:hypothetical protein